MSGPVVVDTNVVVAGLLSSRPGSPVVRILDGMLAATFPYVLSEHVLHEYRRVLLRPRLASLHGMREPEVDTLLVELARHAIVLSVSPSAIPAPDAGDQHLWNLLSARPELRLVSGDSLLVRNRRMAGRVLTPADFVASWS